MATIKSALWVKSLLIKDGKSNGRQTWGEAVIKKVKFLLFHFHVVGCFIYFVDISVSL
jgi:hypothetical protein